MPKEIPARAALAETKRSVASGASPAACAVEGIPPRLANAAAAKTALAIMLMSCAPRCWWSEGILGIPARQIQRAPEHRLAGFERGPRRLAATHVDEGFPVVHVGGDEFFQIPANAVEQHRGRSAVEFAHEFARAAVAVLVGVAALVAALDQQSIGQ